nr:nucleotide-binding alpha-beta plait domain-containing protein [Tanacetum cinerariifolium]
MHTEMESKPALVLDSTCVNQRDYSNFLLGKVKDIASLSNLKVVLGKEGFENIEVKYMGGDWIMCEFQSKEAKQMFQSSVGIGTWFSQLQQASADFILDGRVTWVEIKGIPLKMWSENTFNRIAFLWGTLIHVEDQKEVCLHRKRICINTKINSIILESFKIIYNCKVYWVRAKEISRWVPDFVEENEEESDMKDEINGEEFIGNDIDLKKYTHWGEDSENEVAPDSKFEDETTKTKDEDVSVRQDKSNSDDPFNIYDLLNKKDDVNNKNANEKNSLKFPPGFTPNNSKEVSVEYPNKSNDPNIQVEESVSGAKKYCAKENVKEDVAESICSGHFQKAERPRSDGSILQLINDMVKVGQTMGYNMEGSIKNMAEIIESQGRNGVHR